MSNVVSLFPEKKESKDETEARLARIKESLERINSLLAELKEKHRHD